MKKTLFLSHDSRDSQIAKIIAGVLKRITLSQLDVWYSSDCSRDGGLQPGQVWLDEIRSRLCSCDAVVALITKQSIQKPWLLFECGFAAANANKSVILVAIGIDTLSSIPFPLGMYQCYQLADYDSLKTFTAKMLSLYGVVFDEELAAPLLKATIGDLTQSISRNASSVTNEVRTLEGIEHSIKAHIDLRLSNLLHVQPSNLGDVIEVYSVPIRIKFLGIEATNYIDIGKETSVQDILDNIYFMINSNVQPFTYLSQWILYESKLRKFMVVREVADMLPARFLFTRESQWEVRKLDQPWRQGPDDHQRWYRTSNQSLSLP